MSGQERRESGLHWATPSSLMWVSAWTSRVESEDMEYGIMGGGHWSSEGGNRVFQQWSLGQIDVGMGEAQDKELLLLPVLLLFFFFVGFLQGRKRHDESCTLSLGRLIWKLRVKRLEQWELQTAESPVRRLLSHPSVAGVEPEFR